MKFLQRVNKIFGHFQQNKDNGMLDGEGLPKLVHRSILVSCFFCSTCFSTVGLVVQDSSHLSLNVHRAGQLSKNNLRKIVIIFLSISLNLCYGCSKEPSHKDGSFEYPQHMFWLRNKKNNFQLHTLILGPYVIYNPYAAIFFVKKISSAYYIFCIYSNVLQTNTIESNTLDPDQTASYQTAQNIWLDLDPNCLTL